MEASKISRVWPVKLKNDGFESLSEVVILNMGGLHKGQWNLIENLKNECSGQSHVSLN